MPPGGPRRASPRRLHPRWVLTMDRISDESLMLLLFPLYIVLTVRQA